MKMKSISTIAKVLCLVGVAVWGQNIWAQNEEVLQNDTIVREQPDTTVQQQPDTVVSRPKPRLRPRALVMGYISSHDIMPHMPQYIAMQESLASLKQQYEAEAKKSEDDFQRKFEEFMHGQKDFPKTILEKRQNELQIMLETNAAFRIKAQKLLVEAERNMMADVKAELAEAIAIVAQEKGVSLVFDLDGDSVPYIVPGIAANLTAAVRQYLGIE